MLSSSLPNIASSTGFAAETLVAREMIVSDTFLDMTLAAAEEHALPESIALDLFEHGPSSIDFANLNSFRCDALEALCSIRLDLA